MLSWTNVLNSWTELGKARRLGPGRRFATERCWLWRHRFHLWKFSLYSIFWIRYHLRKYMEHIMWRFRKYEQNMFGEKCVRSSRLTPIILWLWLYWYYDYDIRYFGIRYHLHKYLEHIMWKSQRVWILSESTVFCNTSWSNRIYILLRIRARPACDQPLHSNGDRPSRPPDGQFSRGPSGTNARNRPRTGI